MSYGELNAATNRVANALRSLGIQRGDHVALMLPNVLQFPIIYYGILKMGATVVPLSPLLKAREVHDALVNTDAAAIFAWEDCAEEVRTGCAGVGSCRHLIIVNTPGSDVLPDDAISFNAMLAVGSSSFDMVWTMPDDTAVILLTSGTTGQAKGVELTHFNLFYNAVAFAERALALPGNTVGLAGLPLFHSFGQSCAMNSLFYSGGTLSLLPRFDAHAALDAIARDRVTYLPGVPTMFHYLVEAAGPGGRISSTLSTCISGGAPMLDDLPQRFKSCFGLPLLEGYGLTEASPVVSVNVPGAHRTGSAGKPLWGVDVRIVTRDGLPVAPGQIGEVAVCGHNVMKGYYKSPNASAETLRGNWLHSGDMGRQDADGYLYIVDRRSDVINRAGFSVYPSEVEAVLRTHPAVADAGVVGVPDPVHGEEIFAGVVLKPEQTVTANELIAYCRERIAAYKYPRYVDFFDAIPKDTAGKLVRRNLRS
jgi:long-chain acyl-CoA synthetase